MEDFLRPRFLNLELLFLNHKPFLLMKINDGQVPTTKQSLEFRFSLSKSGIPDQQEVLHLPSHRKVNLDRLILNSKLCLMMKNDDRWVPITNQSLEFRFSQSKLRNPDQWEVFQWKQTSLFFLRIKSVYPKSSNTSYTDFPQATCQLK